MTEKNELIEYSAVLLRRTNHGSAYGFVGSSWPCFIFVSYTTGAGNAGRESVYI